VIGRIGCNFFVILYEYKILSLHLKLVALRFKYRDAIYLAEGVIF